MHENRGKHVVGIVVVDQKNNNNRKRKSGVVGGKRRPVRGGAGKRADVGDGELVPSGTETSDGGESERVSRGFDKRGDRRRERGCVR